MLAAWHLPDLRGLPRGPVCADVGRWPDLQEQAAALGTATAFFFKIFYFFMFLDLCLTKSGNSRIWRAVVGEPRTEPPSSPAPSDSLV